MTKISAFQNKKSVYLLLLDVTAVISIWLLYVIMDSTYNIRGSTLVVGDDSRLSGKRSIQFDEYKHLTDNEDSVYGQVATVGDNAYVVWQESVPGESNRNYDIFFRESHDNGNSFGKEINLSNNKGFSEHPQISGFGDSVYVVWADDSNQTKQVMFKKSNNAGDSFGRDYPK
ncbi:MAG TPA: hypothetical protein VE548_08985 [Nitrososphaeraceae archaeon]|jgi:hypothetical protein|nr:hypothetical protein [Nitrososphaeraceae archaeon]